ncbi:hypothetical protein VKI21_09150 [Cyanobacterium aponinum UTEX 3222]|uniref:hypothetical protein n=1 Tax=Cyanobacterium aponinum TaxID=379064 RepID=UPI002B4C1A5A|nr:hypothetical protein [Cyanobacterium aponinum]WRL37478.1 hypothetical protein VKI22_12680 [Cyanobacterium aponinum UTEX 3221]WRL43836.1 hypothetical protein VKI21_09150 [Cyanobacterium aponinum UTEX 3222]
MKNTTIKTRLSDNLKLDNLVNYYRKASTRLNAAKNLSEREHQLAVECSLFILQKYPEYEKKEQWKQVCIRDIQYFIRCITYCLVADSTEPIDNYLLNGLKELYQSLGLSLSCCISALEFLKENNELVKSEAEEVTFYIDYLLNSLS